jgi:hypothetical protein
MRGRFLKAAFVLASLCVSSVAFGQAAGGGGQGGGGNGGGTGGDPSIMQLRNSDHQQRVLGAEYNRRKALGLCGPILCDPPRPPVAQECLHSFVDCSPREPNIQNSESCNSGSIRRTVVSGIPRYSCEGRRRRRG